MRSTRLLRAATPGGRADGLLAVAGLPVRSPAPVPEPVPAAGAHEVDEVDCDAPVPRLLVAPAEMLEAPDCEPCNTPLQTVEESLGQAAQTLSPPCPPVSPTSPRPRFTAASVLAVVSCSLCASALLLLRRAPPSAPQPTGSLRERRRAARAFQRAALDAAAARSRASLAHLSPPPPYYSNSLDAATLARLDELAQRRAAQRTAQ